MILYKKVYILYITILYIFKKIIQLYKSYFLFNISLISYLKNNFSLINNFYIFIFNYKTIYKSIKWIIYIKQKIRSYIWIIANIKKIDLKLTANVKIWLIMHFEFCFSNFFAIKNILYIILVYQSLIIKMRKFEKSI